jgi:hypothetical protein
VLRNAFNRFSGFRLRRESEQGRKPLKRLVLLSARPAPR